MYFSSSCIIIKIIIVKYTHKGAGIMISNQILQSTIDGLKSISRTELGICDTEGKMLASTFPDDNRYEDAVVSFVASQAESQVHPLPFYILHYQSNHFLNKIHHLFFSEIQVNM